MADNGEISEIYRKTPLLQPTDHGAYKWCSSFVVEVLYVL